MSTSRAVRQREGIAKFLDSCDPETLSRVHCILAAQERHRRASPPRSPPSSQDEKGPGAAPSLSSRGWYASGDDSTTSTQQHYYTTTTTPPSVLNPLLLGDSPRRNAKTPATRVLEVKTEPLEQQLERTFRFFDQERCGLLDVSRVRNIVQQLTVVDRNSRGSEYSPSAGDSAAPELLQELLGTLDSVPDSHKLDLEEFKTLVKQGLGFHDCSLESTVHSTRTAITRAKKLAMEQQGKESLHAQMTTLLQMQYHYRLISSAEASVDSWHYSPNSKCYHGLFSLDHVNPRRRRTGRLLPAERMHLILSGEVAGVGESSPMVSARPQSPVHQQVVVPSFPRQAPSPHNATANWSSSSPRTMGSQTNSPRRMSASSSPQRRQSFSHSSGGAGAGTGAEHVYQDSSLSPGGAGARRRSSCGNPMVHEQKNDFLSSEREKLGVKHREVSPKRNPLELVANDGARRASLAAQEGEDLCEARAAVPSSSAGPVLLGRRGSVGQSGRRGSATGESGRRGSLGGERRGSFL